LQGLGKVMVPAICLACGAVAKTLINLTFIPRVGVYAAPIGSNACVITAMLLEIYFLHKSLKLNLNYKQTIVKPISVTILMGIIARLSYEVLKIIIGSASIATIMAIIIAIVTYFLSIVIFKILDQDDYHMLPYGDKIYKFLQKIKLVKPTNNKV